MKTILGYLFAVVVGALGLGLILLWQQKPIPAVNETFVRSEIRRAAKAVMAEEVEEFNYTYETVWAGSAKQVRVSARARVFAGFDLEKHLVVVIDPTRKRVAVELGRPEIIGVDLFDQHYLLESGGMWNWFSEKDRDAIAAALRQRAESAALAGKLRAVAQQSMRDFLTVLWRGYGYEVNVEFDGSAAVKQPTG